MTPLSLLIALGGACGTLARYLVSGFVGRLFGEMFPWGTLVANVTGCFAIGFFATLTGPEGRIMIGGSGRQIFMTGFCGGYTTFSSFSLQTLNLARDSEWLQATGNVLASVELCLLAVWLGHLLAAALNAPKG